MADQTLKGKQLGQLRPANTTAASLYSPAANVTTEITKIIVTEHTGATPTFRIFHDEDGTTYDETTALVWDSAMSANGNNLYEFGIWMRNSAGNLAVRTSAGSQILFTCYGIEHED